MEKKVSLFEEVYFTLKRRPRLVPDMPKYITDNLKYPLFDWQQEALTYFLFNQEDEEKTNEPTHLMFNMATGTGKTLVMAATILYYYQQGYRHFIFFVNQNNIVGKTEENLTNASHNKYLFQPNIVIDNQMVDVRKVERFTDATDDIQILFTSIHKLHNAVHQVKENQIYLEDLQTRDIVMLGDEAHHLNADTKKQKEFDFKNLDLRESSRQDDVERSWEHTVLTRLLNRDIADHKTPCRNVLLEFTATIPREKAVREKYLDKIIYQFDLRQFLKAGFTKEINLVSSNFDKKQRVLQALLFNWYRHAMALGRVPNFKPVMLFRSKFVDAEQGQNSKDDYEFFLDLVKNVQKSDFDFINNINVEQSKILYQKGQSRIVDIKNYIDNNPEERYQELLTYIRGNFQTRNCIITNSKQGTKTLEKTNEETERLLNNLEDKNNHIRAIFTVKRLTEGWDVQNLYDIVRMYEGRDETKTKSGARKGGESTVSEVQLIGRGVRYYPFKYRDEIPNKRKFDKDLDHELRVLEELYFHSENTPKYVSELKKELERQELLPTDESRISVTIGWKPEFDPNTANSFFNSVFLWQNSCEKNPNRQKQTMEAIRQNFEAIYDLSDTYLLEKTLNLGEKDTLRLEVQQSKKRTISELFKNFKTDYKHLILKAMNIRGKRANSIYHFNNLQRILAIKTIDDIFRDEFLGLFEIKLVVPQDQQLNQISRKVLLDVFVAFFERLEEELIGFDTPYIGSSFELKRMGSIFTEKTISVTEDADNTAIANRLNKKNWYAMTGFYGTSEEQELIKFLEDKMGNFEDEYDEVALVRNESVYKIYDFEQGRGFMPDFLLFLKKNKQQYRYQIFIEPKGSQFKGASGGFEDGKEGWKEQFLKTITKRYGIQPKIEAGDGYFLIGLPLFNKSSSIIEVETAIQDYLNVKSI
jgi:type III restriction enzyme